MAIDGPAGAGKSTVARLVADALGFLLVDTGALYRAVALGASQRGVPWGDGEALGRYTAELVATRSLVFQRAPDGTVRVCLDGEDVSDAIRAPAIALGASQVSAHPRVRENLLELQRAAGRDGGVVLEGRDIGTVVFPEAEAKFFLTARPDIRARRRHEELLAKAGDDAPAFETTLDEVIRRDEQDRTRAVAPLRKADDALEVDTSDMTMEEVVATLVRYVHGRPAHGRAAQGERLHGSG